MQNVGIIERAFQLASECGSLNEVRQRLAREGYSCVEAHLAGRQIKSDIQQRLNPELRAACSHGVERVSSAIEARRSSRVRPQK